MGEIEALVLEKLAKYRDRYRNADENGFDSLKKASGKQIKKLNQILEIL